MKIDNGDIVTFRSYRGKVEGIKPLEEDGVRWTVLTLRMEHGGLIEVDADDLDEAIAQRVPA